jgi:ornithine carbamoyltransferase
LNYTSITDLSKTQIQEIFHLTNRLKKGERFPLSDKTFLLFFPETSLRTKVTFERGIKELGGQVISFPSTTLDKREELSDVIKYLKNWADAIVVRHKEYEKIQILAAQTDLPIINAMTSYNHPCEILSDIYALSQRRKDFLSLTYTFVGERGNIGNSWINLAQVLNLNLIHVSTEENRIKNDDKNYTFTSDLNRILPQTDIILTDSLSAEAKNEEYFRNYQITLERMERCKKGALLNPCPPFYRKEEVSTPVIDSKFFVGYEFKKDLLEVQKGIILYCLGLGKEL